MLYYDPLITTRHYRFQTSLLHHLSWHLLKQEVPLRQPHTLARYRSTLEQNPFGSCLVNSLNVGKLFSNFLRLSFVVVLLRAFLKPTLT